MQAMAQAKNLSVPETVREDIERAVRILKEGGCTHIFLFGSAAKGRIEDRSDLDLAVRGCPPDRFFGLLGRLLWELDRPVDLVDLDAQDAFAQYLQSRGELIQVG